MCFLQHQQHLTYFEKQLVGQTKPSTELLNKQRLGEQLKQMVKKEDKNRFDFDTLKERYDAGS